MTPFIFDMAQTPNQFLLFLAQEKDHIFLAQEKDHIRSHFCDLMTSKLEIVLETFSGKI